MCPPLVADFAFQLKVAEHALAVQFAVPSVLPSTETSICRTCTLSVARTLIFTVLAALLPGAGETMLTLGAVVSGTEFLTITVIVVEDLLFPAASYAIACSVCPPPLAWVVSQAKANGAAVLVANSTPSR